jgi:predicted secreted protein
VPDIEVKLTDEESARVEEDLMRHQLGESTEGEDPALAAAVKALQSRR